jgi:hypothetical protein
MAKDFAGVNRDEKNEMQTASGGEIKIDRIF